ncbi:MAG: prolipoprotein diacylglyceryl transferase [Myxococcota bacterium]|nr:prolipoprotein diacylglyceryl transferase [Myxococcota bacterium]
MHPILFEIPTPGMFWGDTLPIYSYGVMLGSSMIVAWYIVMWLGEREGFERETLANTFIATAVSAIVGARLLYVITMPHEFESIGDVLNLRAGGLVAYGGFLGGFLGALAYLRHKNRSLLSFADVTAPTLALGLALTRVGCYLYGCDFGAPLGDDAPQWLRDIGTFPHWANDAGSPAWSHHVAAYDLAFDAAHSLPVHPTQIYESLAGFVLFGATLAMWRMRTFRGQVLLSLAMLYGFWRFGIEYVRDDPERGAAFGFSTSQLISLAIVPVAAFFYFHARRQQQESPQPVMRAGAPETYMIPPSSPVASATRDRDESTGDVAPSAGKRSGAALKKKPRAKKR